MEFNNRLYELRKQKGLSQEELANRLNVSRQTISKWEVGDSTPDMDKLVAISDLFGISLDELVLGKDSVEKGVFAQENLDRHKVADKSEKFAEIARVLEERVVTTDNKKKAKKGLKIAGFILGIFLAIDLLSMIIYFVMYGVPK